MNLPDPVPPVLSRAIGRLSEERQELFTKSFFEGSTAEVLADYLALQSIACSASSIRIYRRAVARRESLSVSETLT